MDLLVLGANGLLGSQVATRAVARGWTVSGTYHTVKPDLPIHLNILDIRDTAAFENLLESIEPLAVINCAAMTNVDACEHNPKAAMAVNGHAPGALASASINRSVRFCQVSTDYVFDGEADSPYTEDNEPAPIQTYGESKLAGERAVQRTDDSALVVRLSFVYGRHGATDQLQGFPAWLRGQLSDDKQVPLFTDQWVTPTRAGQAAKVILNLIEREESDTFHVACRSCVTPLEFGKVIGNRLPGLKTSTVVQKSLGEVDQPAARPAYTCLDVEKVETVLGRRQPTLTSDLDAMLDTCGSFIPSDTDRDAR